MSLPLFLTRAALRREASLNALLPLLLGDDAGARAGSLHRLVWSLFADSADRQRDFLWREIKPGEFLILSERPPEDRHAVFLLDPPKPFAPALQPGDRLHFSLRANPIVRKALPATERAMPKAGRKVKNAPKHDVVMDALKPLPEGARAELRLATVTAAGRAWLLRKAEAAGFAAKAEEISVDGYAQHRLPRPGKPPIAFSTVDLDGLLTVREPEAFLAALAAGFGSARAFGCGLMLIRRARLAAG